jgi:hypothetical protein
MDAGKQRTLEAAQAAQRATACSVEAVTGSGRTPLSHPGAQAQHGNAPVPSADHEHALPSGATAGSHPRSWAVPEDGGVHCARPSPWVRTWTQARPEDFPGRSTRPVTPAAPASGPSAPVLPRPATRRSLPASERGADDPTRGLGTAHPRPACRLYARGLSVARGPRAGGDRSWASRSVGARTVGHGGVCTQPSSFGDLGAGDPASVPHRRSTPPPRP